MKMWQVKCYKCKLSLKVMSSMATGVIFKDKCENTNSWTIFSHWLPFPLPGSKWRIIPNITECALNICKYVPIIIYVCAWQRISTHPAPQAPKLWAIRNRRCSGPHSRINNMLCHSWRRKRLPLQKNIFTILKLSVDFLGRIQKENPGSGSKSWLSLLLKRYHEFNCSWSAISISWSGQTINNKYKQQTNMLVRANNKQ